jgi:hypothetical protein
VNGTAAPSNRVAPRVVVAVVVAALALLGLGGLVAVAIWGGDEPTGAGLEPGVDVEAPDTAPDTPASQPSGAGDAPPPPPGAQPSDSGDSAPPVDSSPPGGDDVAVATPGSGPAQEGAVALDSLLGTSSELELPPPPSAPVEIPDLVTTPPPASTVAAVPLPSLGPDDVAVLAGWEVDERRTDYLRLIDGGRVAEVFLRPGASSADEVLTAFFDEVRADADDVTESARTRLAAPSARYVSVVGAQYEVVDAAQQGTRTLTGSAIAGAGADTGAVVITVTRRGPSSRGDQVADGELLRILLAYVEPR